MEWRVRQIRFDNEETSKVVCRLEFGDDACLWAEECSCLIVTAAFPVKLRSLTRLQSVDSSSCLVNFQGLMLKPCARGSFWVSQFVKLGGT